MYNSSDPLHYYTPAAPEVLYIVLHILPEKADANKKEKGVNRQ